ncbi:MAG: hypothetical protein GC134_05980 [Proteobacteria bacterium]|nr:hypothetical protein [Pseudomonadota bacterium]
MLWGMKKHPPAHPFAVLLYALLAACALACLPPVPRSAALAGVLLVWGVFAGWRVPFKFLWRTCWMAIGFVLLYGYMYGGVRLGQQPWAPTYEGVVAGWHMYALLAVLAANSIFLLSRTEVHLLLAQSAHIPVLRQLMALVGMTLVWVTHLPHLYRTVKGSSPLERARAMVWHALWDEEDKIRLLLPRTTSGGTPDKRQTWLWALWPTLLWLFVMLFRLTPAGE